MHSRASPLWPVPDFDEVSVEFDSGHRGHMDVGDQAIRFDETRGCEEIGRGGESFDGEAQGPHKPSHGLAKEPIVLNDRGPMTLSAYGLAVRIYPPCGC